MANHSGYYDNATGDLLACGFYDDEADWDNERDTGTTTVRTDVPIPAQTLSDTFAFPDDFHRWNGTAWEIVART